MTVGGRLMEVKQYYYSRVGISRFVRDGAGETILIFQSCGISFCGGWREVIKSYYSRVLTFQFWLVEGGVTILIFQSFESCERCGTSDNLNISGG